MIERATDGGARKAWLVLPSLAGGGAERVGLTLAAGLRATQYEPTLYLFAREGPFLAQAEELVPVVASPSPSRLARVLDLRDRLAAANPAVVVAFLSYLSPLVATRLSRCHARVIFSIQTPIAPFLRDPDYPWGRSVIRTLFTRGLSATLQRAAAVAVTSRGIADEVTQQFGVPADRVLVIHNPFDLAQLRSRADEPVSPEVLGPTDVPTIVAAGRLADVKNYPLLFDAFKQVREKIPARLIVLGGGELESSLRARVRDAGLDDAVHLLGFQDNPWKFMARAQVFAMTSRYEGFGNVLVEAMALGLPVVATESVGTLELIRHETNGLLVKPHEAGAVAAALMRVLADNNFRGHLAGGARAAAARFDLPIIVGAWVGLFDRVTAA